MTMMHVDKANHEERPKAGQVWFSQDGVAYTVFSVQVKQVTQVVFKTAVGVHGVRVKAYTHDLSADFPNGKLNGKKCHWVDMWNDEFVKIFQKGETE